MKEGLSFSTNEEAQTLTINGKSLLNIEFNKGEKRATERFKNEPYRSLSQSSCLE